MDTIETRSTSARTAEVPPIVLRQTDTVRLLFCPLLIDNAANPEASVKGEFVYQKKGRADDWVPVERLSLGSIKKGEAYKLELHSDELHKLGTELRSLYVLTRQAGLPRGTQTFVRLRAGLAEFFKLGEPELKAFLDNNQGAAVETLLKIVRWLSDAKTSPEIADRLAQIPPDELPTVSALLGLVSLKRALSEWRNNSTNTTEDYWQGLLSRHSAVLSQVLAWPIVVIGQKAYLGGKRLDNTGGNEIDFIARTLATRAAVLVEIKTPGTPLLGAAYRGVYPLSQELNGTVAQILNYKQSLTMNSGVLTESATIIGEPRCIIIAGNAATELVSQPARNSFELLRERTSGVVIITFDELFDRVEKAIEVLSELS
jgi:hypothetical protein